LKRPKRDSVKNFENKKSIYSHINKHLDGDWYGFLSHCGVDPSEIRLSGAEDYSKLSREHQINRQESESRKNSILKGGKAKEWRGDQVDIVLIEDST